MRKTQWVKLLVGLVITALVVVIAFSAAYLALTYTPSDYQPHRLTSEQQEQAEHAALLKYQDLYNGVNLGEPFTLHVEQTLINDLLAHEKTRAWLQRWNGHGRVALYDPQVVLEPGCLRLMGQVRYRDVDTIISLRIAPQVGDDGMLYLRLLPTHAGALPLPDRYVREQFLQLADRLKQRLQELPENAQDEQTYLAGFLRHLVPALEELLEQGRARLTAIFTATPEGGRARLRDLRITPGALTLELEPLPATDDR